MHNVLALEMLPNGRVIPVEHDFTKPPDGLSRQVRRQWERRYRNFKSQYGMPADVAWYRATRATLGSNF